MGGPGATLFAYSIKLHNTSCGNGNQTVTSQHINNMFYFTNFQHWHNVIQCKYNVKNEHTFWSIDTKKTRELRTSIER